MINLTNILYNYKIARFIFSLSLLFTYFLLKGNVDLKNFDDYSNLPIVIMLVYTFLSFITIFISYISILDFLLDITFISALLYLSFYSVKYFSILYILVLIFAGLILPSAQAIALVIVVVVIYTTINIKYGTLFEDLYIKIILDNVSFLIITLASVLVKNKLKEQEKYIKLLEKEKAEAEAYKKLYRLSAELAHEIKNPLAAIHGAAQLIGEREDSGDKNLLDIIKSEAKRLDNLLSDFLNFASPLNNEKEVINLKKFIEEIIKTYKQDKMEIVVNIDKNLRIKVDKKGFFSALSNMIKNATEWAKSKIVISAYILKNSLIIEIEDDGEGVKEDYKELIFEPFFTKKLEGTGLGLAIANRFVLENKGYIFVDKSKLGGAKFIIKLPLKNGEVNGD